MIRRSALVALACCVVFVGCGGAPSSGANSTASTSIPDRTVSVPRPAFDSMAATAVTIDIRSVLARGAMAKDSSGTEQYAVDPRDVLSGAVTITSVAVGSYVQRSERSPWVEVTFSGSWPPQGDLPRIVDEHGESLPLAHVMVGCTKDVVGRGVPDDTAVAAFVEDVANITTLTFLLGSHDASACDAGDVPR